MSADWNPHMMSVVREGVCRCCVVLWLIPYSELLLFRNLMNRQELHFIIPNTLQNTEITLWKISYFGTCPVSSIISVFQISVLVGKCLTLLPIVRVRLIQAYRNLAENTIKYSFKTLFVSCTLHDGVKDHFHFEFLPTSETHDLMRGAVCKHGLLLKCLPVCEHMLA